MLKIDLRKASRGDLDAVVAREGVDLADAMEKVRPVIGAVRAGGDAAVRKCATKLDGFRGGALTVPKSRLDSADRRISRDLMSSLVLSKKRIEAFHKKQVLKPFEFRDGCGYYGQKVIPLDRVGVYVPGGTADYLSTVLMACIPAKIAGVEEIALCTPGRRGVVPDGILAAAKMCGVSEVHPVGGAHAIAAMAYGTESIPKVRKIVGPGGSYVTAAKLLVRNECEIDFLAGPSEVLIIADAAASPKFLASDMLAQLEHDPLARAVLVTTSRGIAQETRMELERMLGRADRSGIAKRAAKKGAIFVTSPDMQHAIEFANQYAPEHLLIDTKNPKAILDEISNAGSVFLGTHSSVAFGDYCSGTNHILPTMGAAAMKSALSVYDFVKVMPYQSISASGASKLSGTVDTLARSEGLPAHADAAVMRGRRWQR
ncbi:MAG: histidinol dehydrogenase [Euryarchaeota archaeon RBG_13_57_23]|nr:MAG: histidinol dehydrogenase [Euryarchaeota archaeon RBG_13_57_23]